MDFAGLIAWINIAYFKHAIGYFWNRSVKTDLKIKKKGAVMYSFMYVGALSYTNIGFFVARKTKEVLELGIN